MIQKKFDWSAATFQNVALNKGKIEIDNYIFNFHIDTVVQKVEEVLHEKKEHLALFYEKLLKCEIKNQSFYSRMKAHFYFLKCSEKLEALGKFQDMAPQKERLSAYTDHFSKEDENNFEIKIVNYSEVTRELSGIYAELLESLIEHSSSPEPLYTEIMELLLEHTKDKGCFSKAFFLHTKSRKNALTYAALLNDLTIFERANQALSGQLKKWINCGSPTPLQIAIQNERWDFAKGLLKWGADIDYGTNIHTTHPQNFQTPLIGAIFDNKQNVKAQISFLLEQGADPTLTDICIRTPLHAAASVGNVESMKLLLQDPRIQKQIHEKDIFGRTPLDIAVNGGHSDCIRLLNQGNLIEQRVKKIDICQSTIRKKLFKYLSIKENLQKEELLKKYEFLKQEEYEELYSEVLNPKLNSLGEKGSCSGFSFLYRYYTPLELKEEFYSCLELISEWDEQPSSLTTVLEEKFSGHYTTLKELFEQWFNDIAWFQLNGGKIEQYLPVRKHKESSFQTLLEFSNRLKPEELSRLLSFLSYFPGLLIEIGGRKHQTSIDVGKDNQMCYYDSNLPFRTPYTSSSVATLGICKTHFTPQYHMPRIGSSSYKIDVDQGKMNMGISCYQFLKVPTENLKGPGKVPDKLIQEHPGFGWTPLHLAVMFDDLALLEKELENPNSLLQEKDDFGNTPLNLAINWKREHLIPFLKHKK